MSLGTIETIKAIILIVIGLTITKLVPHFFQILVNYCKPHEYIMVNGILLSKRAAARKGCKESKIGTITSLAVLVALLLWVFLGLNNCDQEKGLLFTENRTETGVGDQPNISIDLKIDTADLEKLSTEQLKAIGDYIDKLREIKK
jgi:hypothetical protein